MISTMRVPILRGDVDDVPDVEEMPTQMPTQAASPGVEMLFAGQHSAEAQRRGRGEERLPARNRKDSSSKVAAAAPASSEAQIDVVANSFLDVVELQVLTVSPYCTFEDIMAWARTHSSVQNLLKTEAVWRKLLVTHFRPAFECLHPQQDEATTPDALAVRISDKSSARRVYAGLHKNRSHPFVLDPRARLLLEIHEVREWDTHQKLFSLQRQAVRLAGAMEDPQAVERMRREMVPSALELVSLKAMMGDGRPPKLEALTEVNWPPSAEGDLRQLMEKRLQQRRRWWQQQREHLLQGIEWR